MERKNIKSELLTELIIGNPDAEIHAEILEKEEVKAMMYHQWKNPHEVQSDEKPDLKSIFQKIREKTHPENSPKSAGTQYLIREIDELKDRYSVLKKRIRVTLAVAATIILLLTAGGLYIIGNYKVFTKTYTENIVPNGEKSHVILPDGTRAYLNSGSILRYDNLFGRKTRSLELVGEGYFEVVHNNRIPFIINTKEISVKVIGTKFNVMAYDNDNFVETTVVEGRVSVTENNGPGSLMLTANQKATFFKNTRQLTLLEVNPELYISWKEDILTFDNENFANVIRKLERWYDVSIYVEGKDSITDRYTLTIRNESIDEVLKLISLTTNIQYSIQNNKITITYK